MLMKSVLKYLEAIVLILGGTLQLLIAVPLSFAGSLLNSLSYLLLGAPEQAKEELFNMWK